MVGINVPIPVSGRLLLFGGWKTSLFGDQHMYGPEGINFYTRGKVVTSRWAGPRRVEHRPRFPAYPMTTCRTVKLGASIMRSDCARFSRGCIAGGLLYGLDNSPLCRSWRGGSPKPATSLPTG